MFRLIRGNRLEWRAEVTSSELGRLVPGMPRDGAAADGRRSRAARCARSRPTVDPQTRNAIVYVDLPVGDGSPARAGMFARGEFDLGRADAISLPQTAVVQRDGFSYVFRRRPNGRVAQTKIGVGRRVGDRIEVTDGLAADAQVVATRHRFPGDGDLVRVVARHTTAPAPPPRRNVEHPMINVSSWSIRNPTPAILLFVLLTLIGVMGFRA